MKKKVLMMLPCIAAVAIAICVGNRALELEVNASSDLLSQDVEALSKTEIDSGCKWLKIDCPGWFTGEYEACLVKN